MGLKSYRYLEFSFDEGRYERSKDIVCLPIDEDGDKLPEFHYMAFGGEGGNVHYCTTRNTPDCDCHDFSWGNDRLCKHLLSALEYEGDELLAAVVAGEAITECKVTIICGPPGSGKSSLANASAEFGDFIWDMDKVATAVVWGKTHATAETQRILRAMRDAAVVELEKVVRGGIGLERAWIVWSLPKADNRDRLAKRLNADVIVIEATPEVCVERATIDERSEGEVIQVERAAQRWWDDYEQRPEDQIIMYDK